VVDHKGFIKHFCMTCPKGFAARGQKHFEYHLIFPAGAFQTGIKPSQNSPRMQLSRGKGENGETLLKASERQNLEGRKKSLYGLGT